MEGRWGLVQRLHLLLPMLEGSLMSEDNVLQVLHPDLTLRETLAMLREVEGSPISRFVFGSPCRFIRRLDILVHIVLPEIVEYRHPEMARYLRATSPRWGRSWRHW